MNEKYFYRDGTLKPCRATGKHPTFSEEDPELWASEYEHHLGLMSYTVTRPGDMGDYRKFDYVFEGATRCRHCKNRMELVVFCKNSRDRCNCPVCFVRMCDDCFKDFYYPCTHEGFEMSQCFTVKKVYHKYESRAENPKK